MNRDQFISYLTHPENLNTGTLEELNTLVSDFPYFQSARILLAMNLFKEQNIRYDSELKTTAIYAGNRKILKQHIDRISRLIAEKKEKVNLAEEPDIIITETKPIVETPSEADTITQLKKIIEQRIREIEEEKKLQGEEKKKKPLSKKSKLSLIDEFIQNEPSISRPKEKFYDPVDKAKESIVEQEDIVSETLAGIYSDQGYLEKAINMYNKLILKVPEKSSYFAALIEKAKKELNNK